MYANFTTEAKHSPRTTVSIGMLAYRTKTMPYPKAVNVAKMFDANSRFSGAEVVEAKGGAYVAFVPASEEAQERLDKAFLASRAEKAAHGVFDWDIAPLDGRPGFFSVVTYHATKTGELDPHFYETSKDECNCGDYVYRGRVAGLPCKHMIAVRLKAV